MRVTIPLVATFSLLIISPALATGDVPPKQGKGITVPVVKTWEELLKQPVLDLGDGVKVRLGIEATRCPRWSAVLLYAYTEGYDDMAGRMINRDRLGPLWVSVQFGGKSLDAKEKSPAIARFEWDVGDKQPRLFARPIMVDRLGTYRVAIRTERGKEVASVTVKGVEEPYHPWSPLLLSQDAEHERVGGEYKFRRTVPAKATNLAKGIALPNLLSHRGRRRGPRRGWQAAPKPQAERDVRFGRGPLPKLVPDQPDPGLKLTLDSEKMLLRVAPREPITTYRPDWHFLARWWVNGKPLLPEQVDEIPSLGGGATAYPDDDVLIQLKVNPRALGAKRGDRVELQLLYCPAGWLPVRNPQDNELGGTSGFPRLTNRVSFKLP